MAQDREFELKFSEKAAAMVEELARKTGRSEEQVVEQVIHEYLMNQLRLIERRAEETGADISELINTQFERLLEFLLDKEK